MSHYNVVYCVKMDELDDLTSSEIFAALIDADDLYYNDSESFLTDTEYDTLRRYAEVIEPHNVYFTGIGADVRGGKVKLPYTMGSLDQVYEGEIVEWIRKWGLLHEELISTDKLDGTSAMVIYDKVGDLQIAYSRGNGTEGADITRHIRQMPSVPKNVGKPMVVRGEVIIKKEVFPVLQKTARTRAGEQYKNARNMVAGIMNSKTNDASVYKHIDFVAYDVLGDEHSKEDQLIALADASFMTPHYFMWEGYLMDDETLTEYLEVRRKASQYEIDGLVIDVNASHNRQKMNPTRSTLNPAFAVKYKVADADNQAITTVINVDWNLSKHGYWKTRIQFEPVNLCGVTISNCTGFNAKFIYDNMIGPGAKIQITRSGDVIPFCQRVVEPAEYWQEPGGLWEWNDTGVDAVHPDAHSHDDVIINRLVDFFASIDAPYLKKGNIQKLFDAGYNTPEDIIRMDEVDMVNILGENGRKSYSGLRTKLHGIPLYKLMGAHSNERGLGVRKMKKLQDAFGADLMFQLHEMESRIANVDSFDVKTAAKVVAASQKFNEFYEEIQHYVDLAAEKDTSNGSMVDQKVVFTGFRDKDLQAQVEEQGGTMQSSVSSKTTIVVTTNPNGTSGKLKKARDLGIKVVGVDEFKDML